MQRAVLFAAVVLGGAQLARAESLPSFHLPWAAKAAESVVVVQDGNIAEVWAGDMKVGDSYRPAELVPRGYKVVYGFFRESDAEIDKELAKKGLKRLATVSGKRLVLFIPPEPPKTGIENFLARRHEYSTVWLEEGQAFAISQWINPGPAEMRPLDMTEIELKQAVLDLRAIDAKLRAINDEEDRSKRAQALVALLKPVNRWWNDQVKESIRRCGPAALPAIEAMVQSDEHLPLHADLLYLAHAVDRKNARPLFEKVLATERDYFRRLDISGEEYDRKQPPHIHHDHRRSAALWALDSR